MNIVAELTLTALSTNSFPPLPHYSRALALACDAEPPPFGMSAYGDVFRKVASDPEWLAVSLIANAEREGDGAGRLWSLAACTADTSVRAQIQQHAIDESRHSHLYGTILDITFPSAMDNHLRLLVESLSPGFTKASLLKPVEGSPFAHCITLDDLIQMNIAEIRTRIHQLLQRPMLIAHCEPERRSRLLARLDSLARDELNHVAYTAQLIERSAQEGRSEDVMGLMRERVHDFNEVTREEFERKAFEIL